MTAIRDGLSQYYDILEAGSYIFENTASFWLDNWQDSKRIDGNPETIIIRLSNYGDNDFEQFCKYIGAIPDRGDFNLGVSGDTKYCISYVQQLLSDPVGGCQPTDEYTSMVVVQKDYFVVQIIEYTHNKTSKEKDVLISRLAQVLEGWSK